MFFLAIGSPHANMEMSASNMSFDFNTPGAIFLFFVLIGLINTLFKGVARSVVLCTGVASLAILAFSGHYLFFSISSWVKRCAMACGL